MLIYGLRPFSGNGADYQAHISERHPEQPDGRNPNANLSARWSTRSRYASKLDVSREMDPIVMGMCSIATAESLFAM